MIDSIGLCICSRISGSAYNIVGVWCCHLQINSWQ